jgi:hypothetical protein
VAYDWRSKKIRVGGFRIEVSVRRLLRELIEHVYRLVARGELAAARVVRWRSTRRELAGLSFLRVMAAQLIVAKVKNEYLRGVLVRVDDAVLAAVRDPIGDGRFAQGRERRWSARARKARR